MLKDMHDKTLELIKEIDYICKKNNIFYYAEGGTLIGAIRHNGFIPWDDDADLVMTRNNFEKFVLALKKENLKNRVLEYPGNNKELCTETVKYMDTSSTKIFKHCMAMDCENGYNVDIFILDPIPRGKEKWFKKEFLSYSEFLCEFFIMNKESRYLRYIKDIFMSRIIGREKILNSYRNKLFNFDESECDEYLVRYAPTYQTVKKTYYGIPRYANFCDMKMPIPKNAERILTNFYGDDWFIVPPNDEHDFHDTVTNINKPYINYVSDYIKYVNKEKLNKCFRNSKKHMMGKISVEQRNIKINFNSQYVYDSLRSKKISEEEIIKLYDSKDFYAVYNSIKCYADSQINKYYDKYDIELSVSDNIKFYTLNSLIKVGKYYQAIKLYNIIHNKTDKIKEIGSILYSIREAKILYYEGKYDESLEIVNELLTNDSDNLSAYKIKIDILLHKEINDTILRSIEKDLKVYYDHTKDDEIFKYFGVIYTRLDDKVKAKINNEKYKEAENARLNCKSY